MRAPEVASWQPVSPRWLGHRREPLLHERAWGCPLLLSAHPDDDGPWVEAGLTADGTPVARRCVESERQTDPTIEVAVRFGQEVVVELDSGTEVRTRLDADDRPTCTTYSGSDEGEESYSYDAAGRLVTIEEAECLWGTANGERAETGGTLKVAYDTDGLLRIAGSQGTVWARPSRSWPDQLAATVPDLAGRVLAAVRADGELAGTEVFALMLMYVHGSLRFDSRFGTQGGTC
ncbi:hypothetical protein DSM112329_02981 [Paraconexibacter sp. AEG42_29]|uniref:RHS repeat protein n=1 Tax=Paraconexibacter sp. AEG42_29 TaxID=2997339 RepID=A0AAU7AWW0_9ACTN